MRINKFRNNIYRKWSPTNKIFFWFGIVTVVSFLFGIFVFFVPKESFDKKINIQPEKILIAKNNKNFSPLFFVKNNSDEILNQIWIKLVLNSKEISLRNDDIKLNLISDKTRVSLNVPIPDSNSKVNLSDYIISVGATDSLDRQVYYIFRDYLGPEESLQIQITNDCSKKLKGEHYFIASILNYSDEPVEIFSNSKGPLEIALSPIGENIKIFKAASIIKAKLSK